MLECTRLTCFIQNACENNDIARFNADYGCQRRGFAGLFDVVSVFAASCSWGPTARSCKNRNNVKQTSETAPLAAVIRIEPGDVIVLASVLNETGEPGAFKHYLCCFGPIFEDPPCQLAHLMLK